MEREREDQNIPQVFLIALNLQEKLGFSGMHSTPMNLSKVLFWDTDYQKIDWEKKARYVIGRVVMYGTIEDWRKIQQFYGMDKIKEEVLQLRELDPKTLRFLSVIFDIPQNRFKCYSQIQSNPGHWDY